MNNIRIVAEDNDFTFEDSKEIRMNSPINLVYSFTSEADGAFVEVGEVIEYELRIENTGQEAGIINVNAIMPQGLRVISSERRHEGESEFTSFTGFETGITLGGNTYVELLVRARVGELSEETIERGTMETYATMRHGGTQATTNTIMHRVRAGGSGEEGPSISGTAWLDSNQNGRQDAGEPGIAGMPVILRTVQGQQIAEVRTDAQGRYEFTGLEAGEYIVVFGVDKARHRLTVSGQSSVAMPFTDAGRRVYRTDTLEITDSNLRDINIGLIENEVFDISLNKYVERVTITNQAGTRRYENFPDRNFAKVDVRARAIEGTVAVIHYNITVTNEGELAGTVEQIRDLLPPGLTFSADMNRGWVQTSDGNLINRELAGQTIEAGQSRTIELILTKTITSANQGRGTVNTAEIYEYSNEYGVANRSGNSESNATVMVAVMTGGTAMYIWIVIVCMAILSTGVYVIQKKVLVTERRNA